MLNAGFNDEARSEQAGRAALCSVQCKYGLAQAHLQLVSVRTISPSSYSLRHTLHSLAATSGAATVREPSVTAAGAGAGAGSPPAAPSAASSAALNSWQGSESRISLGTPRWGPCRRAPIWRPMKSMPLRESKPMLFTAVGACHCCRHREHANLQKLTDSVAQCST